MERDATIPADATPLIASTRCEVRGALLWNCVIPDFAIMSPEGSFEDERNPVKTIVTVDISGDCNSFVRWLNVRVDDDRPDNRPDLLFPHEFTTEFRTHDGHPIRQLHFHDMSPDPRYWDYDGSCRAWLKINWNVPDDSEVL